jgi:hypothetical protein
MSSITAPAAAAGADFGAVGEDLVFTGNHAIRRDTADASDTGYVALAGGGDHAATRGAYLEVSGNERAGQGGFLTLRAGNVAGSVVRVNNAADTPVLQVPGDATIVCLGDSSNANMTIGITINQGANDNEVLALKSSDVAHGMTTIVETDTYGSISKFNGTEGGMYLRGFSDSAKPGTAILGAVTTENTTKGLAAEAAVQVWGAKKSGTTVVDLGANANILSVGIPSTGVRFILDADGDSHQDAGTAWTNFDSEDDVSVLNLLAAYVTRRDDPLRAAFGEWLMQRREPLERLRLVTFNEDGHHFVNMSRLTMLLVGAARQLGERVARLESRLLALEASHG